MLDIDQSMAMIMMAQAITAMTQKAVVLRVETARQESEDEPLHLGVATAATEQKPQNGEEALMVPGHCAMPVAYTMQSLLAKWGASQP